MSEQRRAVANAEVLGRMNQAEPVLVDMRPALDVVPGMAANMVLTSGWPLPWQAYDGGQRRSLIYGALFEGLARDEAEAERKFGSGEIVVGTCHAHGCVGSVAGIYTASMPVFAVENKTHGNRGFCNFYEAPRRGG
jgi:uncharacterized protein DUF1116